MKRIRILYTGLIIFIFSLVIAIGYLANQNRVFREKNRELLLQNDSIQSVNQILLNNLDTLAKFQRTSTLQNGRLTFK